MRFKHTTDNPGSSVSRSVSLDGIMRSCEKAVREGVNRYSRFYHRYVLVGFDDPGGSIHWERYAKISAKWVPINGVPLHGYVEVSFEYYPDARSHALILVDDYERKYEEAKREYSALYVEPSLYHTRWVKT